MNMYVVVYAVVNNRPHFLPFLPPKRTWFCMLSTPSTPEGVLWCIYRKKSSAFAWCYYWSKNGHMTYPGLNRLKRRIYTPYFEKHISNAPIVCEQRSMSWLVWRLKQASLKPGVDPDLGWSEGEGRQRKTRQ